ncbi:hypothetical protein ACFY5K_38215 [Streptomyces griseofuscus]|uniref:hypothetical protein n=1 Tax=Streptomyces griseofuscus TaxID=146922 RepID=UPI0036B8B5DB
MQAAGQCGDGLESTDRAPGHRHGQAQQARFGLVGRQGGRQVAELAVELAGQYHAALGRGVGADLDDLLGVDRRVLIPSMKRSVCHPASDSTTGDENPQGLPA